MELYSSCQIDFIAGCGGFLLCASTNCSRTEVIRIRKANFHFRFNRFLFGEDGNFVNRIFNLMYYFRHVVFGGRERI